MALVMGVVGFRMGCFLAGKNKATRRCRYTNHILLRRICSFREGFFAIPLFIVSALIAVPQLSHSQTVSDNSNQLRAAYLFQFTRFIKWPDNGQDSIRIGIYGEDLIIKPLMSLQGRRAMGKTIEIKTLNSIEELHHCCELLYVSTSENAALPLILSTLGNTPTLTVNDANTFLASGGMVSFVSKGNKLRFKINRKKANANGLKISAELLKVSIRY